MRDAKIGRCGHLYRTIAERACDGEGLPPETDGPVIVARDDALHHHEGGSPNEPVLVAKRPREHLRLVEVNFNPRPITEGVKRVPQVDVDVDGQLGRLPGLGADGGARRGPAPGGQRRPDRRPATWPGARLAEAGDRLLPQLTAQGVMSQPLRPLNSLGDAGVQGA